MSFLGTGINTFGHSMECHSSIFKHGPLFLVKDKGLKKLNYSKYLPFLQIFTASVIFERDLHIMN